MSSSHYPISKATSPPETGFAADVGLRGLRRSTLHAFSERLAARRTVVYRSGSFEKEEMHA
jgi:hypothetical protein